MVGGCEPMAREMQKAVALDTAFHVSRMSLGVGASQRRLVMALAGLMASAYLAVR